MLLESIFSTLPMFVCLFGVILLLLDDKKQLSKRYLSFFLLISFINYFTHAVYFNYQYKLFALMDNFWVLTSLSGYPLFYYYIRLLTKDEQINWKWMWSLLPAILLFSFSLILYFVMSPSEMESYIQGVMYHKSEFFNTSNLLKLQLFKNKLFKIIFLIQVPIYLYLGYENINKFDREIKNFYSNVTNKNICKVRGVLFAFVFASIISIVSSAIGKDYFIDKPFLLMVPSITHSIFLIAIVYVGYKQSFTVSDYKKELLLVPSHDTLDDMEKSVENHNFHSHSPKELLEKLLEKDKIFINPDLRITDVAKFMGTNRTYVSRIVNEDLHTNFNDLINKCRVEYAKELMNNDNYNHLTLSDIAFKSGFSTTSSFYRIFNNFEKVSPGKFRKNILENAV